MEEKLQCVACHHLQDGTWLETSIYSFHTEYKICSDNFSFKVDKSYLEGLGIKIK